MARLGDAGNEPDNERLNVESLVTFRVACDNVTTVITTGNYQRRLPLMVGLDLN
jgi:hypothetical protein